MKKHLLLFLSVIFSLSIFAADLNPFAYNLYTSTNADGGTQLHFSINAFAPTVEVYIIVGGVEKKIRTYSNVAKNNYSTDLTASDAASAGLTAGSSYSWKVKVTTPDRSSSAEYVGRKVSDKPIFSIDIDNNPASPYFSRILATHGTDNIANAQGIYAYNAAFEANGGRNMGATAYANWWSGNHLTPYRIRIAQDGSGRIFLANYDPSQTGAYLWQVDPAKLTSWTQLIARSWMKSNVGINADGNNNALDVYNFGLDIRTSGNKYELLLLSANSGGTQFVTGQVYSGIYTIPNITAPATGVSYKQLKWNKVTGEQSIRNLFGSAINSSAIFDKYGGVWYCGNSSNGTQATYPGLAHQFATATDYKINYDDSDTHFQKKYTSAGGIRYDKNHERMVVAQGMNRTNIVGCIYTVTQASAGTRPTLGSRVDLNAGAAKGSASWYVTDFAWDYADNIYACVRNTSADVRGVYAFATDLGGKVLEVAARSNFTLQLPKAGVEGTTGLNPYAYDVSATYDDATYKLTVKFSLNADAYNDGLGGNADGVQIFLTDDPANPKKYYVYGVPGNQCFKGQNKTCTIDLISGKDKNGKEIPRNTNLYASVTVQGDRTNANPREVSQFHKIMTGHSVAVDKCPNSKNFGTIFITEARQQEQRNPNPQTNYFTKGFAGVYTIDPTFDNANTTRYTGNNDFSLLVIEHNSRYGYQPWRVRVSEEGRIFVCSNDMHQRQADKNGVAVWEIDRNNFNNWTPILRGVRGNDYTFTYQGNFIGPVCGMDVRGTGDNLTLLLYTTNLAGVDYDPKGFRAYEYNVKTKVLTPINTFNNGGYGIAFEFVSLVYGVDGSYWFGASRANSSGTLLPNIAHVKRNGTNDYTNKNGEFHAGSGLINYKSTYPNDTYNAANHSWLIKGSDLETGSHGEFDVLLVNTASDGTVTVGRMEGTNGRPNWRNINITDFGKWVNDFAIDYAENLYVIGSATGGERVRAFAMPYCGEKTSPALNEAATGKYTFQLKGQAITWHPYHCPETMINEDLWELFMEDYNEWYYTNERILPEPRAVQPITNAIGFTFPPEEIRGTYPNGAVLEFLQNHPQWKWLYSYINTVVNNEATTPTSNEALWAAFKVDADITVLGTLAEIEAAGEGKPHDDSANPCSCRKIAGQLTNDKMRTIYANNSWEWLFDYIKTIQTGLSTDLTEDAKAQAWRYAVAAFFLQSQHTVWPATADFSTAGLPTEWGPKATAAGKTYAFSLTGELTWRLHVHAFFNKTNSVTYKTNNGGTKTDATADFTEAGDPYAWYNQWADVTFPKVMRTGDKMPKIKRKGYIFAGWHYGTEEGFTRDQKVADSGYDENAVNHNHIWARWMELCVYEGYVKPDPHFLGEPENVNYNEELMSYAAGKSYQIDIERKFLVGSYSTLSLPFAIPKNAHADYFVKVTDENGTHIFDPANGGQRPSILVYDGTEEVVVNEEKMVQFNFHELRDDEQILAHRPFLFKPAQEEALSARLHFWSAYLGNVAPAAVDPETVSFLPTPAPMRITIPEGNMALILVDQNRLAGVSAAGEMLGLRGYFLAPKTMSNLPARICIKENAPTEEENVATTPEKGVHKVLENQRIYIITEQQKYDILGNFVTRP